ncbi:hypothetical protein [Pedobacter sp.]|uniref:hypothetical protein n=1 Tax=Pedobacter sp. TaxID=1411316 RepID=UPI003D7FCD86
MAVVFGDGASPLSPVLSNKRTSKSLLNKAGFFLPPMEIQLWMMGAIGILANLYMTPPINLLKL